MSKKLELVIFRAIAALLMLAALVYFAFGGPAAQIGDGLSAFTLTPEFAICAVASLAVGAIAGALTTYTDWRTLVSWNAASAPFGMRPIYDQQGRARARCYVNGILSGYASAIYQYSPVVMVTASSLNSLTIAATGSDFLGVLDGIEYTDANGRRQYSKYWPAGLVPLAGTTWNVYVWDDPNTIYEIQANGSLGSASPYEGVIGQQLNFASNIGSGSSITQISAATADTATLSNNAQKQLRIMDKARYVDNDWGDSFTVVQVKIAQHQYAANKVAV